MRLLGIFKLFMILTAFMSITCYADWNESDEVSTLQSDSEAISTPYANSSDDATPLSSPDSSDDEEDEDDDF